MREQCTKDNPYTKERDYPDSRWEHADAREVGDQEDGWPGGDIVHYECVNCGKKWSCELPQ